jgi:hypothetical protein
MSDRASERLPRTRAGCILRWREAAASPLKLSHAKDSAMPHPLERLPRGGE